MHAIELLVTLKIPDVTTLTAAGALRRRMGYEDALKALSRADYYRLELEAPSNDKALELAAEIAEKTNLFVNPNKNVYELRSDARESTARSDGSHVIQVLVTDPADGSARGALAALQGRLGYGDNVTGLWKGVLWTRELECESPERARDIAEDIAVTRAREKGLLMNPHFQECEVW
jgi:phosphoribosylformylglycinamidine (FGAM) synthase PurS component